MENKKLIVKKLLESYFLLISLFLIGIVARVLVIHHTNVDTDGFLVPWYDYIKSKGVLVALGDNFANYTPPYTYLLAVMTLTPVSKIIAIKLIPIGMDLINSFIIYKIVKHKYPSGLNPFWATAIFWCLPSVILNSAWWGQADSFYTGFLLMSMYFLIMHRPLLAMLFFSVSMAFKLQAIFLAPIFVILLFIPLAKSENAKSETRIKYWHFLLIPIMYSIISLPVVMLGRGWANVWSIYIEQANAYKSLSEYAANFYVFIPNSYFHPVYKVGLIFATICMCAWIAFTVKKESFVSKDKLILIALSTVALAPFLLPKMHERYFYPADLISLLVAFYLPRLWFLPVGFQLVSCLSYYPVLSITWAHTSVKYAALINTCLIGCILWNQFNNKFK